MEARLHGGKVCKLCPLHECRSASISSFSLKCQIRLPAVLYIPSGIFDIELHLVVAYPMCERGYSIYMYLVEAPLPVQVNCIMLRFSLLFVFQARISEYVAFVVGYFTTFSIATSTMDRVFHCISLLSLPHTHSKHSKF